MDRINFFAADIDFALADPQATAAWLQKAIYQEGYQLAHLNVIFCTDQYLHAYNLQYLQHDTFTDILTFDYADTPGTLEGELYISIQRVQANAQALHLSEDQELHTVLIHGVLHLMGYDDHTPTQKATMRQKEAHYLAQRLPQATPAKKNY